MENLDWLAEASVQHQRVVSALAQRTEVLPARFGTVFLTGATLEADIRKKRRILERDLARIRGCDEFGIKVFRIHPKLEFTRADFPSGKDYLKAKAALFERRTAQSKGRAEEFEKFLGELERVAIRTAETGKISGGQRGLEWQISLLVPRTRRKRLDEVLRKYSRQWRGERQIECTGPWPPYSFVTGPDAGSPSGQPQGERETTREKEKARQGKRSSA